MLAALAWRNLWRRPQRTVLSLVQHRHRLRPAGLHAVVPGRRLRDHEGDHAADLRRLRAAAARRLRRRSRPCDRTIADPDGAGARRREGVAGVTAAAPRVNAFAILANGERSYGAAVVGVDPAQRGADLLDRLDASATGRYLRPGDSDAADPGRHPGAQPRRRASAAR